MFGVISLNRMGSPLLFYCSRAFLLLVVPVLLVPYWVKLNRQDLRSQGWDDLSRGGRSKRELKPPPSPSSVITLFGVSVETDPEVGDGIEFGLEGSVTLLEETSVNLVLFGLFTNSTKLRFAMVSLTTNSFQLESLTLLQLLRHLARLFL